MTHKKLQKLCYYAQAWHCALYGEKLFEDEIQAWIHGPVIPSIYPIYADYKWDNIPQHAGEVRVSEKSLDILEAVYNTYGGFSGDQLELLTHSEAPWQDARKGFEAWEPCNNAISTDSMSKYYGKIYEDSQND